MLGYSVIVLLKSGFFLESKWSMDFKGRGINVFIHTVLWFSGFNNDQKEQSTRELLLLVASNNEGQTDSLCTLTNHHFGGQILAASAIISIFLNIRLVKIF